MPPYHACMHVKEQPAGCGASRRTFVFSDIYILRWGNTCQPLQKVPKSYDTQFTTSRHDPTRSTKPSKRVIARVQTLHQKRHCRKTRDPLINSSIILFSVSTPEKPKSTEKARRAGLTLYKCPTAHRKRKTPKKEKVLTRRDLKKVSSNG